MGTVETRVEEDAKAVGESGLSSSLEKIRNAFQEQLCLGTDDMLVFDFIVSVMTATLCRRLDEVVWAYIIAPPGSCKTECMRPFQDAKECVFISSLTENWLMSGYRDDAGKDPSLIETLDGKVLVVKDMSSLTSLPPRTITKIWGDLRDAFDQTASKASGVSGLTKYTSRFGAIMLGTEALDAFAEEHQQLGERFLSFRLHRVPMNLGQRQNLALHVSRRMRDKSTWRANLASVAMAEISEISNNVLEPAPIPTVPEADVDLVMMMGNLLSLLRTTPIQGMAISPELPTRTGQQLMNLGLAHAMADGRKEWNETDMALIKRVTIDTLPVFRKRIVRAMWERGSYRPLTSINRIMECCETTKQRVIIDILTQYVYSDIIEADESFESFALTKKVFEAITKVGIM